MEGPNPYPDMDVDPLCREEPFPDVNPHHCIHGTDAYLLTPASAPPTADSVYSWVSKLGICLRLISNAEGYVFSCSLDILNAILGK